MYDAHKIMLHKIYSLFNWDKICAGIRTFYVTFCGRAIYIGLRVCVLFGKLTRYFNHFKVNCKAFLVIKLREREIESTKEGDNRTGQNHIFSAQSAIFCVEIKSRFSIWNSNVFTTRNCFDLFVFLCICVFRFKITSYRRSSSLSPNNSLVNRTQPLLLNHTQNTSKLIYGLLGREGEREREFIYIFVLTYSSHKDSTCFLLHLYLSHSCIYSISWVLQTINSSLSLFLCYGAIEKKWNSLETWKPENFEIPFFTTHCQKHTGIPSFFPFEKSIGILFLPSSPLPLTQCHGCCVHDIDWRKKTTLFMYVVIALIVNDPMDNDKPTAKPASHNLLPQS